MTSTSRDQITLLLHEWGNGDRAALDKLVPVVYRELADRKALHEQ